MKTNFITEFGSSIAKVPNIYNFKNNKTYRVVFYYLFVTLLFIFPLVINISNAAHFTFSSFGIDIIKDEVIDYSNEELLQAQLSDQFQVIEYLPRGCYFTGGKMYYEDYYDVTYKRTQLIDNKLESETVRLVYNAPKDFKVDKDINITIVYGEYYYNIYYYQYKFTVQYGSQFQLRYDDYYRSNYANATVMKEILNTGICGMIRANAFTICLALFFAFSLINILFIFLFAFCARFLRFKDNNFPSYGEIVKMLVYCSTIPSLVNLVLGLFGAIAIGTVLYNFILPFIAAFVYWRNKTIIKGEMSTKAAKDSQYVL